MYLFRHGINIRSRILRTIVQTSSIWSNWSSNQWKTSCFFVKNTVIELRKIWTMYFGQTIKHCCQTFFAWYKHRIFLKFFGQTIKHCYQKFEICSISNVWQCFTNKCLTTKSFLKRFKNICGLTHGQNVGQATFCDEAKWRNILFDKKISNVWHAMFDRLARA